MSLRRTQELLWKLITAPEGVARGLEDLRQAGTPVNLETVLRGDRRLGPSERLDIYAGMYFYRLHDCLEEDFSKLAAVAGSVHFHNLVTDYLLAHPSTHWSLTRLGAALPQFLRSHPLLQEFHHAADLARLEWARVEVFDAADAVPLSRALLTRRSEADGPLFLQSVPALRLLQLTHDVLPLWRQIESRNAGGDPSASNSAAVACAHAGSARPPEVLEAPARRPTAVMVWRQGRVIYHRAADADEAACLRAAQDAPRSLEDLAEVILSVQGTNDAQGRETGTAPEVEAATRHLADLLGSWIEDGVMREVRR